MNNFLWIVGLGTVSMLLVVGVLFLLIKAGGMLLVFICVMALAGWLAAQDEKHLQDQYREYMEGSGRDNDDR